MSLDFFAGQSVVCVQYDFQALFALMIGTPLPKIDTKYTVHAAVPCDSCGAHVALREMDREQYYPCTWFRPIDPKEMETLRKLLAPDATRIVEKEDALT